MSPPPARVVREPPPSLAVARPDEATPADEPTMARGWLDHLRRSALYKLDGLDHAQLRWAPAPGANSLGQVVVHLGYAERLWLRVSFAGEVMDTRWRAHTFCVPATWGVDDVASFYRAETAAADAVLDGAASFDAPAASAVRPTTLRWIVYHLVEETARHVGHMDIARQLDGRTGR